ncbi:gypsy/ty3 retroelement polyprotein, partial [Tanacetum coccineum]
MVNTGLDVPIDLDVKNWVTDHVTTVSTSLNEKLDLMANSMREMMLKLDYFATDVNRLKVEEGSSNSRFSHMSKLEFLKFSREDVKGWMFKVKQFFTIDNVHEEDKVKIVSIHLHDRALIWHLQFVKIYGDEVDWNVYEEAIVKRFGPLNKDLMAELKNLRYESTIKEYQSQFENLVTQVDITEAQPISMFIAGLPARIELSVRIFRAKSLVDAFSLANLQEATNAVIKQRNTLILQTPKANSGFYANRNVVYPNNSTTTTLVLPAPNIQTVTKQPDN